MRSFETPISLSIEDTGVQVEHGVLALDSQDSPQMNFLSSVSSVYSAKKLHGKQILLSDEAHRILLQRFPKNYFLPLQFFRPIVLGNISVELFPSGESIGSSFLSITKGTDSVFYAHRWSKRSSHAIRRPITKESQTLVVHLHKDPLQISHASVRKELLRLVGFAKKIVTAGENAVLVVDSFGEATNIASLLFENQILVQFEPKLLSIMQSIYQTSSAGSMPLASPASTLPLSFGKDLKKYPAPQSGDPSSPHEPCVILVSKEALLLEKPKVFPTGVWGWVGSDFTLVSSKPWLATIHFCDTFFIENAPDISEILWLIGEVRPKQIRISGPRASACMEQLFLKGIPSDIFAPPTVETLF